MKYIHFSPQNFSLARLLSFQTIDLAHTYAANFEAVFNNFCSKIIEARVTFSLLNTQSTSNIIFATKLLLLAHIRPAVNRLFF